MGKTDPFTMLSLEAAHFANTGKGAQFLIAAMRAALVALRAREE